MRERGRERDIGGTQSIHEHTTPSGLAKVNVKVTDKDMDGKI